ncbi:MAG: fibronectin type III domain-containing protein, partial [Elusimicrobiota bacterium]
TRTSLVARGAAAFSVVLATSVQANWTLNGNPAGLQYTAEASTASDYSGALLRDVVYGLSAAISGLSSDATYYFRVRAATGPYAQLGSTITLAYAPGAGDPTIAGVYASSMTLAWSPSGNPLGTPYKVELTSTAGFAAGVLSSTTYNSSVVFNALDLNTTYYLRIAALNRVGSPSAALAASTSTLSDPPGLAASPFVAVTSSITVRWVPRPASPVSASCEGYRVEASTAPDFTGPLFTNSVAGSPADQLGVGGLQFNGTYYIRVGALNWNGVGNYISLGSTRAYALAVTSQSVPNSASMSIALTPPVQQITRIQVDIPANTLPAGSGVTINASLIQIPAPLSSQAKLTPLGSGVAFDIVATGGQPNGPVTITMTYDEAALPVGSDPRRIAIARYVDSEGRWTILPSVVDTDAHTIQGVTTHFTVFAPFLTAPGDDLGAVQIFPSPWEPGSGDPNFDAQFLTFTGLPSDGKVRLHSILGEYVWEGHASAAGVVLWDGKSRTGSRVGSGVYLAVISGAGGKVVKRVVIVR